MSVLSDFPYNGPPIRLHEGLDVSFQDVPYLVVPALTNRPLVHLAVDCEGVEWHMSSSTRIYARTRCGMQVYADRRCTRRHLLSRARTLRFYG